LKKRSMSCGAETTIHNLGFDYIELKGTKVTLRTSTPADAKAGYKLVHNNQDILKWLCWKGPKDRAELEATYGITWPRDAREGTKYAFAVDENGMPGVFIGSIDVRIFRYATQFEAGYWLGEPYWGKGYAEEALALICYFCFKHLGAEVITSSAFTGNGASRRVMEKNGFEFEGALRKQIFKDGKWIDLWHLSLLREEWETRNFKPVFEKLVPATSNR
jgi:ribosomal-protein-alanine N-acetyltransferase